MSFTIGKYSKDWILIQRIMKEGFTPDEAEKILKRIWDGELTFEDVREQKAGELYKGISDERGDRPHDKKDSQTDFGNLSGKKKLVKETGKSDEKSRPKNFQNGFGSFTEIHKTFKKERL